MPPPLLHHAMGHDLTGDQDLLALHPFRGIGILTVAQFTAISAPDRSP